MRPSLVESRFEALHTATTPLVGREEEIELLMRRWAQAKAGDGCAVLISGEPGIGKSRIAETLHERLNAETHTRIRFFCLPHHQDSALYPAIAQLERAAGFRREDTAEVRLAKLEALVAQATNDVSGMAPLFADLLSIPTGERYPALTLTPQKRKERTLQALAAQAEGLALRQPVLMIFEDVHWSDPTTRELLDLLIDRAPRMRLLALITYRPEFSPAWVGLPHVSLMTLSRLLPRQRAELISQMTGGKTLPREITDQIVERTDGVPLFIEELTKSVIESGVVADAGNRFTLTGAAPSLAIPTSLQASLLARLDRLAPTREVAQIGATIGRSFSHELISAVAQMPRQRLDNALEQLVHAELIFRRGSPPNAEYTFKHALVQDAAYSTLLRSRRQQLHGRVAATLEGHFTEVVTAQPELIAWHCGEAGLNEKAVGYWLKAGQQAVARSAMAEAVAHLEKGLELLSTIPSRREHQVQELDLRLALGTALSATIGYSSPQVAETFSRVSELAEQVDEPTRLFPVLYRQWAYHLVRSEHRLALSFAERIEQRGELQNDLTLSLLGRFYHGVSRYYLGEFAAAYALFEQCDNLRDPAVRNAISRMIAEDAYVAMLGYSSTILAYLGYFDQAQYRADEGLLEARRLRHAHTLAYALSFKMATMAIANMEREVRTYPDELFDLSNESGFPFWAGMATFYRGLWSTAEGQARQGVTLITQAMDQTRATGAAIFTPRFLAGLAVAFSRLGQPAEGLSRLREAVQFIDRTDERVLEAQIQWLQGELLSNMGDVAAAELSYQQALAVARAQQAKSWELRAAMSMARLWRDQGKRDEVRDLLAPVYGWFTEGFDTLDLKEAKVLLDNLA